MSEKFIQLDETVSVNEWKTIQLDETIFLTKW
jgi:hypothetical protein